MDTLPKDIQDIIYKYEREMRYHEVTEELKQKHLHAVMRQSNSFFTARFGYTSHKPSQVKNDNQPWLPNIDLLDNRGWFQGTWGESMWFKYSSNNWNNKYIQ